MSKKEKAKKIKAEIFLFLTIFVSLSFLFFNFSAEIGITDSGDNIRGYAWSSNFGWTSFNCTNNASCGTSDYGVNIIPATMNFSGYAWNSNVGWISFESSSVPPDGYAFNTSCPNTCDNFTSCTACFNPDDGNIYGWAQILSLGDNGWIRLRSPSAPAYYGVSINQTNGELEGWGWNGNADGSGLGWLSFNCLDTGICATSNYKVSANLLFPEAIDLSAPNWSWTDACDTQARHAFLDWTFYDNDPGAYQSAYHVIVSEDNSSSTGVIIDTGKVMSNGTQYYIANSSLLDYNKPYYWFVTVWDDFGFPAKNWTQFDTINGTSTHVLTDNIAENNIISPNPNLTFTTYLREFPDVYFDWSPDNPVKDEEVFFNSNTFSYYDILTPTSQLPCTSLTCSLVWDATGLRTIASTTAYSTMMTFSYGLNLVSLNVTDDIGYSCTTTHPVNVDLFPDWQEIKP